MMLNLTDLAQIAPLVQTLPRADEGARAGALARQNMLTKPQGALGRLEDLAIFMAG